MTLACITLLIQVCLTFELLTSVMRDKYDKSSWVIEDTLHSPCDCSVHRPTDLERNIKLPCSSCDGEISHGDL